MFKAWSPYGFDTGFDPVQLVPMHSRGVDRGWSKSASTSSALDEVFKNYKLAAGHSLIHLSPVVASEVYSCNVNGDGFTKKACRNSHDTFLAANKFLEHDNKDPSKGTGRPVHTAYNEKLARIELLIDIVNEKNDRLLEKLASGQPGEWSMACRIDYDQCNVCGNMATSPKGPCDQPANVPSAGYCKHASQMLGALTKEGHRVFVDNPHPHFFDISEVGTPAEVIARTMQFRKAAGLGGFTTAIGGAALAAQLGLDGPLVTRASLPREFRAKLAIANKLAEIEKQIPMGEVQDYRLIAAGVPKVTPASRAKVKDVAEKCSSVNQALMAFRNEGIILDLTDFAAVTGEANDVVMKAAAFMPRLFGYLKIKSLLHDTASNGTFDVLSESYVPAAVKYAAGAVAADLSFNKLNVRSRLVETGNVKVGSFDIPSKELSGLGETLARKYAAYLLSEIAEKSARHDQSRILLPLTALWRVVNYK